MRLALFALLLVFVVAVLGQGFTTDPGRYQPRQNVDTFELGEQFLLLQTARNTTYPNTQGDIFTLSGTDDSQLIGGERDLQLTVDEAQSGRTVSTSINPDQGVWNVATAQGSSGFVRLQLDGKDNSINLDVDGISPPRDLTSGGTAQAFNISLSTDIQTEFRFFVHNANGNICENQVDLPDGQGVRINYFLPFNRFTGPCTFTAVTAIEVEVEAFVAVDATVGFFGTVGDPVSPSSTPTPSRSPAPATPSPTRTPTPAPSGTRTPTSTPTPTRTPTPAPSKDCMCHCPIFTCALIFDPDDDQNNVYYFDDDDENNGAQGGSLNGLYSANTASSITVSVLAVIVAVVAFIY